MTKRIVTEMYRAVADTLSTLPESEIADIYALSFFIYDECDDPRHPTLTLGYNTQNQWRSELSEDSDPEASDSQEAKWNYAFWIQNTLLVFGEEGQPSADTVTRWVSELGLLYTDADEEADFERCLEIGRDITEHFVQVVCEVASALHEQGVVRKVFGRNVPIIIHELEYDEQIAAQTERSNPPGVAAEFVNWVRYDWI
ncbi:hypothetical protein E4656_03395 [Natronospirillum operosum]|uniref:DUF4303 domain-containing protein n=1 Tax=Natronospirillum operosum TaxID=2759953 RepID=A0A4Z0WIM0_9GAMM|nr:hypothetical protein [Natronospirillum operosum]TGG95481.1 hypothetical protein E4656_03395 [Natronospirillum operosum]